MRIQRIFRDACLAICGASYLFLASPVLAKSNLSSLNEKALSNLEIEKRDAFNLSILLKAQSKAQILMAKTENSYSVELKALAKKLNSYDERNNLHIYSQIVVLDPLKADVGLAIGLPKLMVVKTLLMQNNIKPYDSLSKLVGALLVAKSTSTDDDDEYTQDPHALFFIPEDSERSPCIIIPAPTNTIPDALKIPGLSLRQQIAFENAHEGWHCLDNRYHTRAFASEVYASFDPAHLNTLIGNPNGLDAYANANLDEAFADTAATGEWIRSGQSLSVIALIRTWREEKAPNLIHMTAPVLAGLEDTITKMGIENFKALTETQARDLYYSVTEAYGLNAKRLEIKLRHDYNIPATSNISDTTQNADPDFSKALAFKSPATVNKTDDMNQALSSLLGGSGLSFTQLALAAKITIKMNSWDAAEVLIKRADSKQHGITPSNLIIAYVELGDELIAAQENGGSNTNLAEIQLESLKRHFVSDTAEIDFYTKNHKRPALKSAPRLSMRIEP